MKPLFIVMMILNVSLACAETFDRTIVELNNGELITDYDERYNIENLNEAELQLVIDSIKNQTEVTLISNENVLNSIEILNDPGNRARRQSERVMRQHSRNAARAWREADRLNRQHIRQMNRERRQAERAYRQSRANR